MEYEVLQYSTQFALQNWGAVVGILLLAGVGFGFVATMLRFGPRGSAVFSQGLRSYLRDIVTMSPRRVLAIARLTWTEAIRRKALLVFVLFAVLLMFAGWFLSSGDSRANISVGVQIWFLLTAISWLLLPAVMFLSCWSIPEEIRVRSLHTVVTKPIRRIEVVLGRIVGFGGIVAAVVGVMGIVGYVWVQRQVPDTVRDQLTCRVPEYGNLFFIDRDGVFASKGINTGDIWQYRSYIEGNTRARAVWQFHDVSEDMFWTEQEGPDVEPFLHLESRFEAFRSIKGSTESIEKGLQVRYTLVRDLRDQAFSLYPLTSTFRKFGNELVEGQFQNASQSLDDYATSLIGGSKSVSANDVRGFLTASQVTYLVLNWMGEDFVEIRDAFQSAARAVGSIRSVDDDAAAKNFGESITELAKLLSDNSELLLEAMPRLEVPLAPFNISEFHEGDDEYTIPRMIPFNADGESLARYLAELLQSWSEEQRLLVNGQLNEDLASQLAQETEISVLNSGLLVEVLQEEIDSGSLTISGGRLQAANGKSWLKYFDQIVREERLVSQDPRGWMLTADVVEDLLLDGQLTVQVSCMDSQMFVGMARPDLFIRMPDNPFLVGYSKALLSTALMLMLVVVIGVTASCIVKGPVALFLTFGVFLVGQVFHQFMVEILQGRVAGSGMIESSILLLQQRTPEAGVNVSANAVSLVESLDMATTTLLRLVSQIVPNFGLFSRSAAYIESGFDVPWATLMMPAILNFVGFLIPCVLLGAAFLKFRELESK